jgi:hypothetical protein
VAGNNQTMPNSTASKRKASSISASHASVCANRSHCQTAKHNRDSHKTPHMPTEAIHRGFKEAATKAHGLSEWLLVLGGMGVFHQKRYCTDANLRRN